MRKGDELTPLPLVCAPQEAVARDGTQVDAHIVLADVHLALEQPEDAVRVLRQANDAFPNEGCVMGVEGMVVGVLA
jgi:hypothetical protein